MSHKLTVEEAFANMFASRTDVYTVDIGNGFYMELKKCGSDTIEVLGDNDYYGVTLCREDFPLKRDWQIISVSKGLDLDGVAYVAAKLLVECLIEKEDLGPLWDLLYDGEIVTVCPCCGLSTIGEPVQEDGQRGGMTLLQ